ncbi:MULTISPECIES: peroxiredoxin [Sphingomonas]|uniref:peroxiredoxin n=1 Tax=Sphingomonas TaxID=13687 RepID=UPI0006F5455B|nr:peroxiredoxin [Sphingomonas sp. Leaf230]KQN05507.1 alkyl hydroperoxide reductase [Sphingomonas sp. Leaf230]
MDEGSMIPDVSLTIDDAVVSLASLGAPLVVYFYPKDDTAGCTTEAKDFSALSDAFAKAGITVVGVSKDSAASHAKFTAKHGLTVRLASDVEGVACEAFGVWVEKAMYGRKYMGIERATFLFGADGTLAKAWHKVRVAGHAEAVLAAAKAL